jgi:hypothetical protein
VPQNDLVCQLSSQNVESEDPKLVVHFVATMVFSAVSMFVALGVKRGEQTNSRALVRLFCSLIRCKGAPNPWRAGSLSASSSSLTPRGRSDVLSDRAPRQAYSVMVRHIPACEPPLRCLVAYFVADRLMNTTGARLRRLDY